MSGYFDMLKNLMLISASLLLSAIIEGCSVTPHEPAVVEPAVTDSIDVTQRDALGFALVELYDKKNQGGNLLCRFFLKMDGRLSLCPGAAHLVKSATIYALWRGDETRYAICFRAPLNESYRCYESREASTGVALINDLDSTSSYDDGYLVRSKGSTITPHLYSIDYLDRLQ